MLRLKAKEFSAEPAFKASLGWYQNWKRQHSVSFRAKTMLAHRLPEDMEETTVQFHCFIIAARQRAGYPLSRIYNMDETPMRSELPSTHSLEFTGSRMVPVKTCRAEKRSFTVTLAIAAGGTKLPPKVIFKGVQSPKDLVVPESLRVSFHKKGWMDEAGVKEWIRQCLPLTPHNGQSLLVWDSFRTHLTDEVKADLNQQEIDVAVIPGGLTPVLQPLDKCLNKPFKDNVRRKYLVWMISTPFNYTPARKKAPLRNLVLRWAHEAWREIPVEMVAKSFKTCGISNSLDGTEDDELYTEEAQEIHDDEEDNKFEMEREGESDSE